jgi:F-type H+-transporting ATPase subunit alpha
MKKVAGKLKLDLSQYRELEAFAQFGSELDLETKKALARGERLVATLNQHERSPLDVADQVIQVYAAINGYLDRIKLERVDEFLVGLLQRAHAEASDLCDQIRDSDWSEATEQRTEKLVQEYADDFGYDLDEEGNELEAADSQRVMAA